MPLEEVKKQSIKTPIKYDKLVPWLMSEFKRIERRQLGPERQRHYQMFLAQEFFQCRQYGFFEGQSYLNPDVNRDSVYYQCDYFSEQVLALLTQWMQTEIELVTNPDQNSSEGLAASRAASIILAYHENRFNTATEEELTGLRGILEGGYLIYTYFDPQSPAAGKYKVPIYASREVPNQDQAFNCPGCGAHGSAAESSFNAVMIPGMDVREEQSESAEQQLTENEPLEHQCPACNGPVDLIGPDTMTEYYTNGYKEGFKGEVCSGGVDGFEVGLHPSARACQPETSPWLYYTRRVQTSVIQDYFDWWTPAYEAPSKGLRLQRILENQLGSFAGGYEGGPGTSGPDMDEDMTTFNQIWFDLSCYAPYVFPDRVEFKNGVIVEAGQKLKEVFPDGIYLAVVNNQIVDIRNEDKNNHWVGGAYHPVPNCNWGLGVQSALWQQRLINDAFNFMVEAMRHLCAPTRLYNAAAMDGNDINGNPNSLVPVEGLGPEGDMSKLIHTERANEIPVSIMQFIDRNVDAMQRNTGASNALLGQAEQNISATDARQSKDAAIAKSTLPMRIKAEVKAKRGQQILNLCQKHYLFTRSFPVEMSSDYSRFEVMEFNKTDIEHKLYVTYADHSMIPRYAGDRRNDVMAAAAAGVWNELVPPEQRRMMAGVFQVPYSGDKLGRQARKGEIRFDAIMKEVAKFREFAQADPQSAMTLMMPDPTSGLPSIVHDILSQPSTSISIEFDDHKSQMEWISEWANNDKGLYADDFVFQIMTARFHEHKDAMLQINMSLSADAALAAQPQMAAAQAAGSNLGGAALPVSKQVQQQGGLTPGDSNVR